MVLLMLGLLSKSTLRYGSRRWSITNIEDNQQRLLRDGSKTWAIGSKELKLKELDPDAKKMKVHVLQIIKKYTTAKRLELSTGFGDLESMTKLLEICRVFKILDTKLGERHANSISATMGIVGKGLRGADMLLDGKGGISSGSDTPASSTTQSRLEKRSGDLNSYSTVEVDDAMDNSVNKDEVEESDTFLWDQSLIRNSLQDSDSPLNKVSGVKKAAGTKDTLQGSQVTELTPRAPRKLGVSIMVRKGNKGRLDLKAAEKRTRAELNSDKKEEPDDDKAERQKKCTKRKKSGSTKLGLEDLIGAWGEDNKARMMMEKVQFVLTYRITLEDFFKKFKDGTSVPIAIGRTSMGNTPTAASTSTPAAASASTPASTFIPTSTLKFNTQAPQKVRRFAIIPPESNSEDNDNLVTEDEEELDLDL
ncbi:hypothetical protein L211DRAFT_844858 [Terfezia boudieri ATCC MYA-4762]|uniref:Uncharacterized protein n=1 Tax=Terfezia boudieri ATCC MYA-4762 TaxID=1051890 RepID=A0A3N4M4F4_9PEZI|nr:hypothetical protein L211DRAFT_844858 [Terfezia boudieri ATCC MYA-4762]